MPRNPRNARLVRRYFAAKSAAARCPTQKLRDVRTARFADLLAAYNPRDAAPLRKASKRS